MTVNFPSPPVAAERNNLGTGLLAGVCAAIVAALAYGGCCGR